MKRLILSVVVLIAVIIGINHFVSTRGTMPTLPITDTKVSEPVSVVVESDYVRYPGREGANAFELLQEATEVEFTQFDFGKFIESIGGVKPDSEHFWKLYVNSQGAQVGADDLETQDGDVVEWRLEKVEGEI